MRTTIGGRKRTRYSPLDSDEKGRNRSETMFSLPRRLQALLALAAIGILVLLIIPRYSGDGFGGEDGEVGFLKDDSGADMDIDVDMDRDGGEEDEDPEAGEDEEEGEGDEEEGEDDESDESVKISVPHDVKEKHIVLASYKAQNVSWLTKIPSSWIVKRYLMDEPDPDPPALSVPRNQGREAMAYLTYIIDHYDYLPEYVIFTHGHERSWHQVEPLQMKVRALNLTALNEENYISLRCGDQMGCERQPYIDTQHPNWAGEEHMCDFWKTIVPNEPCPRYVSYKCCAQHAVTRAAIRTRSKADWMLIREPLMHDAGDYKSWGVGATDWLEGMFYEKFWHTLLGAGPEYCPSMETCQQRHFSNAIVCDRETDITLFEGDAWMETKCVSAFDGLDKDAPAAAAIKEFNKNILGTYAKLRSAAGKLHKEQQEAYRAAHFETEAEALPAGLLIDSET